jgi:hypothetical protein
MSLARRAPASACPRRPGQRARTAAHGLPGRCLPLTGVRWGWPGLVLLGPGPPPGRGRVRLTPAPGSPKRVGREVLIGGLDALEQCNEVFLE